MIISVYFVLQVYNLITKLNITKKLSISYCRYKNVQLMYMVNWIEL